MFKNKVDTYLRREGYTSMKNAGLSISQWLPCPLAIRALPWMAIILDIVKSVFALESHGGHDKWGKYFIGLDLHVV